jgi:hypothetical protein
VRYTDNDYERVFGPFPKAGAREFALAISRASRGLVKIDWDSFPYDPDPRNGEVYATETVLWDIVDGVETETPNGFAVVHMSSGGGSAGGCDGFETLAEAQAAAERIAREHNAVLCEALEGRANSSSGCSQDHAYTSEHREVSHD